MKNIFVLLLFFFIFQFHLVAQFYDAGQDPASIKWSQIDTSFFTLVFPSDFKNQAIELANYLIYAYNFNTFSLSRKPIKIPIILHTQTVVSNGFVTWAPKRSEWYACPPQDMYAQPWLHQMAIHEYRHVVQVSQMYRGISRFLYYPFGQMGVGSVAGIYLPRWFLEGDAVVMETALSKSGRGRIPYFKMDLKAQILEKGVYNYNKAMFGSYKNHVPDPYTMGYQLVANARILYGTDIWDKTLKFVARNPYMIVPFAKGFKKITKQNPNQFYKETMFSLDSSWRKKQESGKISYFKNRIIGKEKFYTDFQFPHYINDSEIVALKTGLDDIDRIVKIDSKGNYKILFTPGNINNNSLSYAKNKIIWTEQLPDLRWSMRNYSVIKIYNFETNKIQRVSSKSRYFSPSLSPDARSIAAVEIDDQNNCFLVILNTQKASVINRIHSPDNNILSSPRWDNNGEKIIVTAIGTNGKAFLEFHVLRNSFSILSPYISKEINGAVYFKNYILFNGNKNETDDIIAFDTISKNYFRVTSSKFGAKDPCISEDETELLYSNYTSDGYKIVSAKINPDVWIKIDFLNEDHFKIAELLAKQETGIIDIENVGNKKFEIRKYRKIKNLINFHSWAPVSIDANNQSVAPGLSIMSHNLLSTAFITTGYKYLSAEKTGKYYFDFTYNGWFPVIETKVDYSERKGTLIKNDHSRVPFTFGETNIKALIRVPLKFATGKYFTGIQPSISTTLINISHNNSTPDIFMKGNINTIDYRLYAYHSLKMSVRDLYPKWGQTLEVNYRHSPFGITNYGNIASIESYLYLPSIIKHHGFIAYTGLQKRDAGEKNYDYSDLISYPLGNYAVNSDKLISASLKYYFPLLYPDFSVGSLIYLKRVDMNMFYGKALANYLGNNWFLHSVGSEINSEMHLLRFIAPINLGYRMIYLPDNKSFSHEILFGINFSSIGKK